MFGIPPNYHNSGTEDNSYCLISITGEEGTTGTLTFHFTADVKTETQFTIDGSGYYGMRYQVSTEVRALGTNYRTFEITSDQPVSVSALNHAQYTSESMLIYPTPTLGNKYYVMSYPSLIRNNTVYHPSQFVVVATEDDTTIELFYSTDVGNTDLSSETITLNKHQSYLVQTRDFISGLDLTGSRVESDKPVAVIGSHNRALIRANSNARSYDYLVEMMPPKVTWAGDFYFVPFKQPNDELTSLDSDKFRISPIFNNTEIYIDGTFYQTVDAGEMLELDLVTAGHVKATAPVLVAQYKKSNTDDNATNNSDPFMMVVPPREQYLNEYQFYSIDEGIFTENFITVIIPSDNIGSILLDGQPPSILEQGTIPTSLYTYLFIRVEGGTHNISADVPFGLYVYGYGAADSYGHIGGSGMRRIDNNPPVFQFSSQDECFRTEGLVEETDALDTYIYRLALDEDDSYNTLLEVNGLQEKAFFFTDESNKSLPYGIVLENIYADGYYKVSAYDRKDYKATETNYIKGFTVGTELLRELPRELETFSQVSFWDENFTATLAISNYGIFEQEIKDLKLRNTTADHEIGIQTPFTIPPGETIYFPFAISAEDSLIINDTLEVIGDCANRDLYAFNMIFIRDIQDPEIDFIEGNCSEDTYITISDQGEWNRGIRESRIVFEENVNITEENGSLPDFVRYTARVLDKTRDAFYRIEAEDGEGNSIFIADTIPGFSVVLAETEAIASTRATNMGECFEVVLTNSGLFPVTIEHSDITNNNFSVPPTALPMVIMPGDTVLLPVCGQRKDLHNDSIFSDIIIGNECAEIRQDVSLPASYFVGIDESDCDTELRLVRLDDLPLGGKIISTVYPLPANDEITIKMILDEGQVDIEITNLFGESEKLFTETINKLGIYTRTLDLRNYASGTYYLKVINNGITHTMPITIQ